MTDQEYSLWESTARTALSSRYIATDVETVLDWFRHIKGRTEQELIGAEALEAMLTFVTTRGTFDSYNAMMARLFIYAPLILRQAAPKRA